MVKLCCVNGCVPSKEAIFFKFPNSRTQKKKWLDVIAPRVKITESSVVCDGHFLESQYDTVRGRTRLKAKVVPSLFGDTAKQKSPEKDRSVSPEICKRLESKTDNAKSIPDVGDKDSGRDGEAPSRIENQKGTENGAVENSKDSAIEVNPSSESEHCDVEDVIINYHIQQIRPRDRVDPIELLVGANRAPRAPAWADLVDRRERPPEYIELSVGRDGEAHSRDCLMVMEKVQVDVDPSLMFPESEGEDDDVMIVDHKKPDPISLLTSSDEDEVIIQEPHIDTVEVPDETDEDDVPLVNLVKFVKVKGSGRKKRVPKRLWEKIDYYCVECDFKTRSKDEYKKHISQHSTVLHVCPVCKYMSASKTQFIRHKRKHKYEKRHKCHLCDYKARHSMSLKYHMTTHDGVKASDFKCDQCGFQSDVKSQVIKHIRSCKSVVYEHCDVDIAFAEA